MELLNYVIVMNSEDGEFEGTWSLNKEASLTIHTTRFGCYSMLLVQSRPTFKGGTRERVDFLLLQIPQARYLSY